MKNQLIRQKMRGEFNYMSPILILLSIGCIYAFIFVVPIYYRNYDFKRVLNEKALRAHSMTNDQIIQELEKEVKQLKIPIEPWKDVRIERISGEILISTKYSVELPYLGGKKISFDVNVKRPIIPTK